MNKDEVRRLRDDVRRFKEQADAESPEHMGDVRKEWLEVVEAARGVMDSVQRKLQEPGAKTPARVHWREETVG